MVLPFVPGQSNAKVLGSQVSIKMLRDPDERLHIDEISRSEWGEALEKEGVIRWRAS